MKVINKGRVVLEYDGLCLPYDEELIPMTDDVIESLNTYIQGRTGFATLEV